MHDSTHPKILQLQPYFSTIDFKVIESENHNAVALGYWSNETIALTSKTLEESKLGELIGVSYHELGHIQERHTSSVTLVMMLLYYLLALFYKTVK
ncbi:M48 family metalloprotease [Patescibacteria group bacterium]|nr:M48 family metalloprotease [Patescibacteria group bacterium]